jgi:hypothetical protein
MFWVTFLRKPNMIIRRLLLTVAISAFALPAGAQLSNMMQGALGQSAPAAPTGGMSGMGSMPGMGSMGSMGGMGLPSVGAASPTNLAGVLQYCIQNNYLGGADAASSGSVQSGLLSKFTGSSNPPSNNSAFSAGSAGELSTGNGQQFALGGSGIRAQMTQKVCDQVLKHGQSML